MTTVASILRGLAQADLAKFAPDDPNDPFAAAYPIFGRYAAPFAPTTRDEVVLLRRSIATAPTRRQLGAMPGGLAAFDENDLPAVFRALSPINDPSDRGFPTFTYALVIVDTQIAGSVLGRLSGDTSFCAALSYRAAGPRAMSAAELD
jgi:hypothetical protein